MSLSFFLLPLLPLLWSGLWADQKPFLHFYTLIRPTFDAAHRLSSSYGAAPHDQASSSMYGGGAPNASVGANGQDGFGSNRFVTRLD